MLNEGYHDSRMQYRILRIKFLKIQGDIERQKRKTATAIVTSGALTFMILAAALVTASFLMSPVIEDVFGRYYYQIYLLEMFYLNSIEQLFLFVEQLDQLEVCLPYSRLLTGIPILAVIQNLRWNSNKKSL